MSGLIGFDYNSKNARNISELWNNFLKFKNAFLLSDQVG